MNYWTIIDQDDDDVCGFRAPRFNKEKYCKKNKLGHGQFGPHIYVNDRCKFCNKIDPCRKRMNYGE